MHQTDEITLTEVINSFKQEGINIGNYQNVTNIAPTNKSITSTNDKPVVATTFTFSCTNLLIYSFTFSYLVHMGPNEVAGKNKLFEEHLKEVKCLISRNKNNIRIINILIIKGASSDEKQFLKFHNFDYLYKQLETLNLYCHENNIKIRYLPVCRSKYVFFDYRDGTLYLENLVKDEIHNIEYLEKNYNIINNQNGLYKK